MATNIPPVAAGQLIESQAWGMQVRTEVSNLEANKLSKSGGTMTGAILLPAQTLLTAANSVVRKDYVDDVRTDSVQAAGDTMTGTLVMAVAGATNAITLRNTANNPRISFIHNTNGELLGYLDATVTTMHVYSDNLLDLYADATFQARFGNSLLLIGRSDPDDDFAGTKIYTAGNGKGRVSTTVTFDEAYANLVARHMGEMDANGKLFAIFQHGASGVTAGSITQGTGNTVHFNETSDYRLKNVVGDIVDALARVRALIPRRLEWKTDPGAEFDGFLAHEVDLVAPYAVTGEKDAVLPETDPFDPGGIDAQQFDPAKLLALIVGAIQDLADQVDTLQGRVT